MREAMASTVKPRKILFVHNSNDLYGAEVILLNLIRNLDPHQFSAMVVLPEDMRHLNRLSARLEQEGVPYLFLPLGIVRRKYLTPFGLLQYLWNLIVGTMDVCRLIRRQKIDLVHSSTLTVLSGGIAARLTGKPHLWHIHEISQAGSGLRRMLHGAVRRLSTVIVTVSNAVSSHILKDEPKAAGKIKTIYNGIDLAPYANSVNDGRVRKELDIPQDAIVVGMVGRVSRWKGQAVFVEAARQVLEVRPNLYFVAVGGVFDDEHHYMESLQKMVSDYRLDHFRISDFRQDIPAVMASFNLFVLPSIKPDPFPTVIIEAQAAGLPVIGTACGGVPEMVAPDGAGTLVSPGDAEQLAAAILSMIDDSAGLKKLGALARVHALRTFQVSRFVGEFEQMYREMLRAA